MTVSLATGSGTTAHSLAVRGDDLYETPPAAVSALLQRVSLPKVIWEPACGPGSIVNVLREQGHIVHASDLVEYGCDEAQSGWDFLMEQAAPAGTEAIVTNPPFKLAEEFATHAKALCPHVVMLLRLAFLEGLRWERGLSAGLERVIVFAPRLPFMRRHGYEGPKHSNSGFPFAWFIWNADYVGQPTIEWANWRVSS